MAAAGYMANPRRRGQLRRAIQPIPIHQTLSKEGNNWVEDGSIDLRKRRAKKRDFLSEEIYVGSRRRTCFCLHTQQQHSRPSKMAKKLLVMLRSSSVAAGTYTLRFGMLTTLSSCFTAGRRRRNRNVAGKIKKKRSVFLSLMVGWRFTDDGELSSFWLCCVHHFSVDCFAR